MKRLLTFAAALPLLSSPGIAQSGEANLEWTHSHGGTALDRSYCITTDNFGNVYTAGIYSNVVDFDPGPGLANLTSAAGYDAFITKFDSTGAYQWAKRIGGSGQDYIFDIEIDQSGNIFLAGQFTGTCDFDPGVTDDYVSTSGISSAFVCKLDANGDYEWAATVPSSSSASSSTSSLTIDGNGNVISTGLISTGSGTTLDFDPGSGTAPLQSNGNSQDGFIWKLSNQGNFVWAYRFGGNNTEMPRSITCDGSNDIYVTGNFSGTTDLVPSGGFGTGTHSSMGAADIFLAKYDDGGNHVWSNSYGNTSADDGYSVDVNISGDLYFTGYFTGTVDFNPGGSALNVASNGANDIVVGKVDASTGGTIWAKNLGGSNNDRGNSVVVDPAGNVYTTGVFNTTADFNPNIGTFNLTTPGLSDAFVCRLDAAGNLVHASQLGGAGEDWGHAITLDSDGNIYSTGFFNGAGDFEPGPGTTNLSSQGGEDIYLHKMNQCENVNVTISPVACDSYSSPAGNIYTVSGTYTETIPAINSCDSTITINLTITGLPDTALSVTDPVLTASASGVSYQWLDCNNGFSPVNGATAQSFTPATNGSYALLVSDNGCTDTSTCYSIVTVGVENDQNKLSVNMFPNPAQDRLFIETVERYQEISISVTNALGKEVLSRYARSTDRIELDLSFAPGIYFIRVSTPDKKSEWKKLVIQ